MWPTIEMQVQVGPSGTKYWQLPEDLKKQNFEQSAYSD